jgi:hypothetical protein
MRYTFSDDEEDSDDFPMRRSARNSGVSTPVEHAGPTVTASGRHVKSRLGGMYGETMLMDQRKELENERAAADNVNGSEADHEDSTTQPQRSTRPRRPTRAPKRIDDSSDDMNAESDAPSSNNDWSGNDEEPDAEEFDADGDAELEEDEEMSANDSEMDDAPPRPAEHDSLVVQLRYKKGEDQLAKLKDRPSIEDSRDGAAADCIAVDSGQARKDAVHLSGEASTAEETKPSANGTGTFRALLPPNGVNGASLQPGLQM